jgi:hypothetical protein
VTVQRILMVAGYVAVGLIVFRSLARGFFFWQAIIAILIGAAVIALIIILPRRHWQSIFRNHFGWAPPLLGAASIPYWGWYASRSGGSSESFFEISAQVIPVFMLATIIDVRQTEGLNSHQLILPLLVMLTGELEALDSVAFGGSVNSFQLICGALVTSVSALIMGILANYEDEGESL